MVWGQSLAKDPVEVVREHLIDAVRAWRARRTTGNEERVDRALREYDLCLGSFRDECQGGG